MDLACNRRDMATDRCRERNRILHSRGRRRIRVSRQGEKNISNGHRAIPATSQISRTIPHKIDLAQKLFLSVATLTGALRSPGFSF